MGSVGDRGAGLHRKKVLTGGVCVTFSGNNSKDDADGGHCPAFGWDVGIYAAR